jgi:transcriptional regulator with XRE-family HTH domain
MKGKSMKLSDQIRRAVDDSGLSRYAICRVGGFDKGMMSRFMAGKGGLSLTMLDRLAAVLALDVVARGKPKALPCRRPGRKPKSKKGGGP